MDTNNKINRVLNFISGARLVPIKKKLEQGGFSEEDLAEGARLLEKAETLAKEPQQPQGDALAARCEEFQRRWFRPTRTALARSFPQIADEFFKDFVVEPGPRAVLSVRLFVNRLAALATGVAPYGEDGPKARQLLRERMLTEEVENEGIALASTLGRFVQGREDPEPPTLDAAVAELWSWYLDWSGTARTLVTSKGDLRALGYRRSVNSPEDAFEEGEILEDDEDDSALGATPPVAPGAASPGLPSTGDADSTDETSATAKDNAGKAAE